MTHAIPGSSESIITLVTFPN